MDPKNVNSSVGCFEAYTKRVNDIICLLDQKDRKSQRLEVGENTTENNPLIPPPRML
jgi:hypothetical protein